MHNNTRECHQRKCWQDPEHKHTIKANTTSKETHNPHGSDTAPCALNPAQEAGAPGFRGWV